VTVLLKFAFSSFRFFFAFAAASLCLLLFRFSGFGFVMNLSFLCCFIGFRSSWFYDLGEFLAFSRFVGF
jgi:hypothetical protein